MKHTCPACSKEIEFEKVDQYIAHVNECNERIKASQEQELKLKRDAEKSARLVKVEEARKQYIDLQSAFTRDYPEEPAKKFLGPNYALLINGKRQPDEVAEKFFNKLDSIPFPGWF
jgi:DNA repair exonuclease SbcCD ATPase subunit